MSADTSWGSQFSRGMVMVGAGLLAMALIAALVVTAVARPGQSTLTVDFDRTVSLYEGSKVRILGVNVGTVEKLTPRGQIVRAEISWDSDYAVPADVQAVIVSPSVVGDRFVQLTPAYTAGPKLKDGTHLDQTRTATPTELDETFAALDEVATTLGPEGLNEDGAVSDLLANSADNLEGKGAEIRESIAALAKLTKTADGTKDELFTSVEQIESFVSALEANDASVRQFNASLAGVSDVLADESDDLQTALRELAGALVQVRTYVADNRTGLRKNVKGLKKVTASLARQRADLAKVLERGPKALSNLAMAYNPTTGTLDARGSIKGSKTREMSVLTESAFVGAYCSVTTEQNPKFKDACTAVSKLIGQLSKAAGAVGQATASGVAVRAPEVGAPASATLAYVMGVA